MRDRNAILDMKTLRLHFCGPREYDLSPCELAPSGHLVLPCSEYAGVDKEEAGSLDTGADMPFSPTLQTKELGYLLRVLHSLVSGG